MNNSAILPAALVAVYASRALRIDAAFSRLERTDQFICHNSIVVSPIDVAHRKQSLLGSDRVSATAPLLVENA
jgi:hypothetical protein